MKLSNLPSGPLLFGLLAVFCATLRAEPASGTIATGSYGVDKNGAVVGEKRVQRIWFHGRNVREELLINNVLVSIDVRGDSSWAAFPAAGRMLPGEIPFADRDKGLTYPAITRRSFAQLFAKHEVVANATIKGLPCWKYSWHEPEHFVGDIGSAAHDVTYWVYADREFPFVLGSGDSFGGKQDLLEFRLNCPIAPELFQRPKDLTPIQTFQLPQTKFLIEFEEDRASKQYGWKTHSREVFAGDGDSVKCTYTSTTTEVNGRVNPFSAPDKTLTYAEAARELGNRLQTPMWFAVKRTGHAEKLNLPTDVLETIVDGDDKQKWWVADHPLLGTIGISRRTDSVTEVNGHGVVRLEVDAPKGR